MFLGSSFKLTEVHKILVYKPEDQQVQFLIITDSYIKIAGMLSLCRYGDMGNMFIILQLMEIMVSEKKNYLYRLCI